MYLLARARTIDDKIANPGRLAAECLAGPMPGGDRVDEGGYRSVVTEAVGARNGWKRILRRFAPRPT